MEKTFRLTIQYDGQAFSGYELQPGLRTIRGELEKALLTLFKKTISVSAVSRTDAGVHATEALIFFKAAKNIPIAKLPLALNSILPDDIRVIKAGENSRLPIKSKTYEYLIYNNEVCPPLIRRFVWHIKPKLNISKMKKAAKCLIGKHDFTSFCASGVSESNNIKIIHSLDIGQWTFVIWGGVKFKVIRIKVAANGFLYKMVRNMVGTLVEVGLGRLAPADILTILTAKDRRKASRTAPSQGLCLIKIS